MDNGNCTSICTHKNTLSCIGQYQSQRLHKHVSYQYMSTIISVHRFDSKISPVIS